MIANDVTYNYIENLLKGGKWALETEDLEELGSVYERQLTNLASDRIPFVQEELICFGKKLIRKYNVQQIRGMLPFEKDLAQKVNNRLIKQEILLGPYAEGTKIFSQHDNNVEKLLIECRTKQVIKTNRDLENRLEKALKMILDASTRVEAKNELLRLFEYGTDATKFLAFVENHFKEPSEAHDHNLDRLEALRELLNLDLIELLLALVNLNREEHFDAIVPLVCSSIGPSSFSKDLAIQTLIQLMNKMPKDENLVSAAKTALNLLDLSREDVKIELYDCLLKWDESIEDVVKNAQFPERLTRSRFWQKGLKLLAKNGKALDFVKTKIQAFLSIEPIGIRGTCSAPITYFSAVELKILGVDLLVILIEEGFSPGEERKILEDLKIWAERALNDLKTQAEATFNIHDERWGWDEENEKHYDPQMKESLDKFGQAILASEKRRHFKRAQ